MSRTAQALADKVIQLPVEDRAYLAERLLESLDEADIAEEWAKEAKRRRDEVRSGRVKPLSAREVYRRIDEVLRK